jgi:glycosyltransferase involved in cell wall biosynthesis
MSQITRGSLVSVVIPTCNRSELVFRAVASALSQSYPELEVVVVLDGPDPATVLRLRQVADPRLKVVQMPVQVGGCEARNAGVREACGGWIAFLDDDDEWLPDKLALQYQIATDSRLLYPIVACKMLVRTPMGEFVLPRRLPYQGEHVSDYLMVRNSLFHGEGLLQTSMLFFPRDLLLQVPFTPGLRRHQESDLLIRAHTVPGVGLEFADQPLGVWYKDEKRASVSVSGGWKYSFDWIASNRQLVTPKAYASFIFTGVSALAAQEKAYRALLPLFNEARKNGKPGVVGYLLFAGMWLIPMGLRRAIRTLVLKK